jgi:hypothetical protein
MSILFSRSFLTKRQTHWFAKEQTLVCIGLPKGKHIDLPKGKHWFVLVCQKANTLVYQKANTLIY